MLVDTIIQYDGAVNIIGNSVPQVKDIGVILIANETYKYMDSNSLLSVNELNELHSKIRSIITKANINKIK